MQGQQEENNKKARPRMSAGLGACARHRWTNLSTEGCHSPRSQAGLLTSGYVPPGSFPIHINQWLMPGTRRPAGRQPVTVAGPRQICTAFPILPLPWDSEHLRRYLIGLLKGLRWNLSRVR